AHDPSEEERFDRYAGARSQTYARRGRIDPTRIGSSSLGAYSCQAGAYLRAEYFQVNPAYTPYSLHGVHDHAELLAYHDLNDPDVNSRLEANAQGRYVNVDGQERYSPLLSTRPLAIDRDRHMYMRQDPNPNR